MIIAGTMGPQVGGVQCEHHTVRPARCTHRGPKLSDPSTLSATQAEQCWHPRNDRC